MRSSWGTDLVTPAAQAITEAICLYAYVVVLPPPDTSHPGFAIIASLFVLAAWLGRLSAKHKRHGRPDPWLLLGGSLLIPPIWLLAMLAPDGGWAPQDWLSRVIAVCRGDATSAGAIFILSVMVVAVWSRGLVLGARPADPASISRRLMGGVAALLGIFIVLAFGQGVGVERFTGTLQSLVLSYFVLAPTMLALVHLNSLHGHAGARQPVSFAWIVALAIPVALIVAVGLSLSFGVTPLIRQALRGVLLLWLLLSRVVTWLVYWPLVLLDWLAHVLRGTSSGTSSAVEGAQPSSPRLPPPPPDLFGTRSDLSFTVLTVATLLLGAIILLHLVRRSRSTPAREIDDQRSSAWSWALFWAQVRTVWQVMRGRIRQRRYFVARTTRQGQADADTALGPMDIRAVYRGLLRWAAAHGHPRRPATTPDELRQELASALPETSASVAMITLHYEAARYGDADVAGEALAASRAASERLDTASAQQDRDA